MHALSVVVVAVIPAVAEGERPRIPRGTVGHIVSSMVQVVNLKQHRWMMVRRSESLAVSQFVSKWILDSNSQWKLF